MAEKKAPEKSGTHKSVPCLRRGGGGGIVRPPMMFWGPQSGEKSQRLDRHCFLGVPDWEET